MKFTIYFLSFFLVFSQSIFADIYMAKQWHGPEGKIVNNYHELHFSPNSKTDQNVQFDYLKKIFDKFSEKHPDEKLHVLVESITASTAGKMLDHRIYNKRFKLMVKFYELFKPKSLENLKRNNVILHNVDQRMLLVLYNDYFNNQLESFIYHRKKEDLHLFQKKLREIFEYVWGPAKDFGFYKDIYQKSFIDFKQKLLDAGFEDDEIETIPLIALFNGAVIEGNQEKIKMFKKLFSQKNRISHFGHAIDGRCLFHIYNSEPGATIAVFVGWWHSEDIERVLSKLKFKCEPGCGHIRFARNKKGEIVKSIHSDEEAMTLVPVSNDVFDWMLE